MIARLRAFLPSGGALPEDVWRSRHRFLLGLTWLHAVVIALVGPLLGYRWEWSLGALLGDGTVLHTLGEGGIVAVFAALGMWRGGSRAVQATAVGFGLMSSSAILVHLSGGYIELHFHFFVMLAFLALYQDWIPFGMAIVYVAVHHGVVGVLWAHDVYNHPAAFNAPWTWAGIHAFFVLWASLGSVIAWRFNEIAFARTKLILESAGEGIYGLDLEGRVTFMNPAAVKMLGLDESTIVGRPMHEVVRYAGADGRPFDGDASPILRALRAGAIHQSTHELCCKNDATSFPVDYVSTPVVERGHLIGAVVSFRDVTERRQAMSEILRLKEELEQRVVERTAQLEAANRELEAFTYTVSHDLKAPLRGVDGFSRAILEDYRDRLDQTGQHYLEMIRSSASRMGELIDDLLHYSRLERREPKRERVVLRPLIERVLEDLEPELRIRTISVRLSLRVDTMEAEREGLREVLANLIGNAVKFSHPAGGTIIVESRVVDDTVVLSVADTGIGFDMKYHDRIFRIFERLHRQEDYPGTGVGLAIVRKVAERHGGRAWAVSDMEKGSTFYLALPVAKGGSA